MCGLYSLRNPSDRQLRIRLWQWQERPTHAIRPGTDALVYRAGAANDAAEFMRWGFRPTWADAGQAQINARAETVDSRAMFGKAFRTQRCLVLADGFFEGTGPRGARRYYFFQRPDAAMFAFAGIWTRFERHGALDGPRDTFAIITCEPNTVVAPVHARMPVILGEGFHAAWLDPDYRDVDALKRMLRPWSDRLLEGWEVGSDLYRKDPTDATITAPIGPMP